MSITSTFSQLAAKNETALVAFIVAGDPTPERAVEIAVTMANSGVDVLELGIPFSDPAADGPVIRRAGERALAAGMSMGKIFDTVRQIRAATDIPMVLFSYYNPIFKYGEKRFYDEARAAGADGVLTVDLPFGEKSQLRSFDPENFPQIDLVAPTTTEARMKEMAAQAEGFLYLISKTGLTGTRSIDFAKTAATCEAIKAVKQIPVCTGFGIQTEDDVKNVAAFSDGVVIGSAFVKAIEEHQDDADLAKRLGEMAAEYKAAAVG